MINVSTQIINIKQIAPLKGATNSNHQAKEFLANEKECKLSTNKKSYQQIATTIRAEGMNAVINILIEQAKKIDELETRLNQLSELSEENNLILEDHAKSLDTLFEMRERLIHALDTDTVEIEDKGVGQTEDN